jgi:hypothetical protein
MPAVTQIATEPNMLLAMPPGMTVTEHIQKTLTQRPSSLLEARCLADDGQTTRSTARYLNNPVSAVHHRGGAGETHPSRCIHRRRHQLTPNGLAMGLWAACRSSDLSLVLHRQQIHRTVRQTFRRQHISLHAMRPGHPRSQPQAPWQRT